jgi:hypothetical protein
MSDFRQLLELLEDIESQPQAGDFFDLELGDTLIETYIKEVTEDGVVIHVDETALQLMIDSKKQLNEWMKMGADSDASSAGSFLEEEDDLDEAEYRGRKVPLGKPMKGDVAKSKVYVKGPKGNVVKVNFGDKNMRIKKNIPARRKSFRARHNCDNPGPRWKARYWSCRAW